MRYKLVCEQNVFCYPDVRTYVYKANYPKSLPLLLQNFSIWNSLSDILSAPLFVATISIHLCCLRRWISSRRSSLQRIFRCQIFPCEDWQFGVLVFAVLFAWEMAWDSPIVNIVLQTMKTQLFMSALVIDGNLKLLSVECCLETKMCRDVNYCMTSWRTPSDISDIWLCSSLGPTRGSHTARVLRARRDYKLTSLGASRGMKNLDFLFA